MKKTFSLFLMLLALTGLAQTIQAQAVNGNGNLKTENRAVASFTGLSVSGGFEVILTQGSTESLKLEADENILPLIETKVQNGVLTIKTKPNSIRNAKNLKVYVTVRNLQSLNLAGGIKLSSTNSITGSTLKFDFSGGIDLQMAIQVKELIADISGGTKINLSGRADKVTLDIAGATSFKALDLKTNYFTIDAAGASSAQVNVAKELTVDAAGIVNVDYKGSPKVKHSGMGKVKPI